MESTRWDADLRIKHINSDCQLSVPYYVCTVLLFFFSYSQRRMHY